jgi:transcriptional regulator with XRE-family HTH domain
MAKKTFTKSRKPRAAGKGDKLMGQRIRVRRSDLKMSQETLGDKLGVSFQQIQKYEKGVNRISGVRLGKIAEVLQVPMSFFYDTNAKHLEAETLMFDDPRFSLRLLRAYVKIPSDELRHQFVVMMEKVAEVSSMPGAAA